MAGVFALVSAAAAASHGRTRNRLMFFMFLTYVQAASLVALVLVLCGFDVSHASVAGHFLRLLGTKFASAQLSRRLLDDSTRPVMFLCNHRSWGDFFVDSALLGGTSFMARWAVAGAIPCSAAWGWLHGWLWFFKRGAKRSEGMIKFMTDFCHRSHARFPGKGVVLYPEGTRNLMPRGLPLKSGGLATAYALGWPVQVVITTNKEAVLLERKLALGFGAQCVTSVSAPLWPRDCSSCDAFIAAVRAAWQATWQEAYGSAAIARPSAQLPGAVHKIGAPALPGNRALNKVRLVLVLVLMRLLWRWWSARSSSKVVEDAERK